MKSIFLLMLLMPVASATAEDDWRKAAREFLAAQKFAPIEIKPGTRFQTDLSRDRWAWMQRVVLPVFEKHLEKWPAQAERARGFVKQALMAQIKHPEVDRARTPEMLEKEGLELEQARVDDPLVLWATAWAAWDWREGYMDALARLHKAAGHQALKDYPAVLHLMIRRLIYDIEDDRNDDEPTHADEYFKAGVKAATDPASYASGDDEILWHDTGHVFYRQHVEKHQDEMEKLAQTPGVTPWLREMMLGKLHSSLGWKSRGGGFTNTVTAAGWKGFEQHMPEAVAHFRKAWELRKDRADPAAQMIDILKAGFAEPDESLRLWFDRSVAAQFDATDAYYEYVWALRPRWGGSVNAIRALLLACALADRPDTEVAEVVLKLVDFIKSDSDAEDDRTVLQTPVIKEAVLHTVRRLAEEPSRAWERPWRFADLGVHAWKAAEYPLADDILRQVPVPFPRQTRRKLHLAGNEMEVRGLSAIHAIGMEQEWQAAQDAYLAKHITESLQICQDIAGRFQGEPPGMLLERMAACKFEQGFAKGKWVKMHAFPDMAEWHHLSGQWRGLKTDTLHITGHDGQGYLLHNGRVGRDFELRGEYTVEGKDLYQGLSIMLGYHRTDMEHFIACAHWGNHDGGALVTLLRDFAQTNAPHTTLRGGDHTWRFHIFCKEGRVTFRLNHHDILLDHLNKDDEGEAFEMHEDGLIGFCHHFFGIGTTTEIRHLEIRRVPPDEKAPAPNIAGLHQIMQVEIADRAVEAKREKKEAEAEKITAFGLMIAKAGAQPVPLPAVSLEERMLHSLLRGYHQSVAARLTAADQTTQPPLAEEPLAGSNSVKWQPESGAWTLADGVLTGGGDSSMLYDFNRAPPFQIDFEVTVLDGMRPRLVMGKVKFANEAYKTTFGLYPQPKGAPLFTYERNKPYQITIKATKDKTELWVDGAKVCDGPKIEGVVDVLQFRGGDDYSKGKTEFRKVHISPLP